MWWQFLKVSITNCIENTYCISTNPMASQENFWFSLLCTCFSLILYQMCLWYWKNHHLQLEKFWRYFLKDGKSAYFGSSLVLHFLSFVILFVTRLCFEVIDQIRLNFLWKILIFSFVVRHSSHFQKSFTMALGGSHTLQKTWTIPIKGSHNIFIMNQQFVPVSKQK